MVKQLKYLLIVSFFVRCTIPSSIIENHKNHGCYSAGVNSMKLEMNGYFEVKEYDENLTQKDTTVYNRIVLYEDGFCVSNFSPKYFEKNKEKRYGFYRRGTQFGSYQIQNDTLKIHFVESPGGMSWTDGFIWFEIIDSKRIKQIARNFRTPITEKDLIDYKAKYDNQSSLVGNFVPYDTLPIPNKSWLKNEKWFWCNEEEYNIWKLERIE